MSMRAGSLVIARVALGGVGPAPVARTGRPANLK